MGQERDRKSKARGRQPAHPGRTKAGSDRIMLYGLHAAEAALGNARRTVKRVLISENAERRLAPLLINQKVQVERVTPAELERRLGPAAVHQGVALDCAPLSQPDLEDLAEARLVLVLDQVTDPHNFGAILRSAAAFSVDALVVTARHSPPLTGTVAKAASGGLEHVAVIAIPNLARGLARLGELGFDRIGLDGEAAIEIEKQNISAPCALVLGAEGKGLRRLTRENCDRLCRLTTCGALSALNVSNAAAIALHSIVTSSGWFGRP